MLYYFIDKSKLLDELKSLTDSLVHSEIYFIKNANEAFQVSIDCTIIYGTLILAAADANEESPWRFPLHFSRRYSSLLHPNYDLCAALCGLQGCTEKVCVCALQGRGGLGQ